MATGAKGVGADGSTGAAAGIGQVFLGCRQFLFELPDPPGLLLDRARLVGHFPPQQVDLSLRGLVQLVQAVTDCDPPDPPGQLRGDELAQPVGCPPLHFDFSLAQQGVQLGGAESGSDVVERRACSACLFLGGGAEMAFCFEHTFELADADVVHLV